MSKKPKFSKPKPSRIAREIKCSLELAKSDRDLVAIQSDENVCRRVLGDDEIAEGILKGISVSLTLEEMADRYGITVAKARRLLARAQGVPEKPRKPRVSRLAAAAITGACERLGDSTDEWPAQEVAMLIGVVSGKVPLMEASRRVQALFTEAG